MSFDQERMQQQEHWQQEQMQQLESWLNSKGITANCPFCGMNNWEPGAIGRVRGEAEPGLGGYDDYRIALIVCSNCAYVATFNADLADLPLPPSPGF